MKAHGRPHRRPWMLPVGVIALIAGPIALYYGFLHTALPAAVGSVVIAVIAVKHLGLLAGLLGSLYVFFRRRPK